MIKQKLRKMAKAKTKPQKVEKAFKVGKNKDKSYQMIETDDGYFVPRDPNFPVGEPQKIKKADIKDKEKEPKIIITKRTGKQR